MSSVLPGRRRTTQVGLPPLDNGDRMSQAEFHDRYRHYPPEKKIELVGGTVYMASPARWKHGRLVQSVGLVLGLYVAGTPGTDDAGDVTVILGEVSEPQPDVAIRLLPECGGQSRVDEDGYLVGAPELVAEVAYSSRSIDMNQKWDDYLKAGVQEYLVVLVEEGRLRWYHLPSREEIAANRQGVFRSRIFPGLWVDAQALFKGDKGRLVEVARQGLAHREHAAFVRKLEAARRRSQQ
jgi:Uma2 family endonuclease